LLASKPSLRGASTSRSSSTADAGGSALAARTKGVWFDIRSRVSTKKIFEFESSSCRKKEKKKKRDTVRLERAFAATREHRAV
jgi:hypothetical protein